MERHRVEVRLLMLMLLVVASACGSQAQDYDSFVGEWHGEHELRLLIFEDTTLVFFEHEEDDEIQEPRKIYQADGEVKEVIIGGETYRIRHRAESGGNVLWALMGESGEAIVEIRNLTANSLELVGWEIERINWETGDLTLPEQEGSMIFHRWEGPLSEVYQSYAEGRPSNQIIGPAIEKSGKVPLSASVGCIGHKIEDAEILLVGRKQVNTYTSAPYWPVIANIKGWCENVLGGRRNFSRQEVEYFMYKNAYGEWEARVE